MSETIPLRIFKGDAEYIRLPDGLDVAQELRTVLDWEQGRMGAVSAAVIRSVIRRLEAKNIDRHCWESGPDDDSTCMLPKDHQGPHEWTRDDEIVISITQA